MFFKKVSLLKNFGCVRKTNKVNAWAEGKYDLMGSHPWIVAAILQEGLNRKIARNNHAHGNNRKYIQ